MSLIFTYKLRIIEPRQNFAGSYKKQEAKPSRPCLFIFLCRINLNVHTQKKMKKRKYLTFFFEREMSWEKIEKKKCFKNLGFFFICVYFLFEKCFEQFFGRETVLKQTSKRNVFLSNKKNDFDIVQGLMIFFYDNQVRK